MNDFDRGYRDGYRGRDAKGQQSEAYHDGWDAGNCDRPSLEELTLDVAKERRCPLSY